MTAAILPDAIIANSRVAAVISDPRLPDNPIIACNTAFEKLTGYSKEEIIGKNCRFLRRGNSDDPADGAGLTRLRSAISSGTPTMAEILNYRKDGTPFVNAVMIAPLFDEAGELAYFLGSQMAVELGESRRSESAREKVEALTRRQKQILTGLAQGRLNKQIAHDLDLTERTIKMHRAAVLRALGVRSVAEAIRIAIEAGY